VDTAGYGALQLTAKSRPLLRGEIELPLRRELLVARKATKPKRKAVPVAESDSELWEALRACRKRLADENNVPPYVIFHDATLSQMAATRPQTGEDLLEISGVGQTKLDRYGSEFLEVVRQAVG
jgi:ATP-dependent DNA helicase RecQ